MDQEDSKLVKLINQCKHNDVDVKIDALTKLQAEFESGIDIPDELIQVMKTCLRTSNQHLSTATLSTLRPLIPLLVSRTITSTFHVRHIPSPSVSSSTSSSSPSAVLDAATLRQLLNALLPVGGLLERLGDRERSQVNSRECLVLLGGFAFRLGAVSNMMSTGSKGSRNPETPLTIFERYLREGGLGSKAWKVREQSILTLVQIRRQHHLFPIRPYLSLLIDTLEDTDPHVRDCARQSVVELFSGPGVTDAARADLKKEMAKKNVRKTIVDGVLSKLLSASSGSQSHENSENGDATAKPKEYIPPSLALKQKVGTLPRSVSHSSAKDVPRPASRAAAASPMPSTPTTDGPTDIQPVYIASTRDLENEFAGMGKQFEGKETETNWAARDRAITRVRGMLKGDVHLRYLETFLSCLRDGFIQWSLKTVASLRTTVATNTCSLYSELASALGASLDPWCETLFNNLLKMAGFTKKITAQQSQVSAASLITHTSGTPRVFVPLICQGVQDKNVQTRSYSVAHLKLYLEVHGNRSKHVIESSSSLDAIEKAIKKGLTDMNPGVKEATRSCFWVFDQVWRDRAVSILNTLDATARKQLEKACPDPDLVASLPESTPQTAKKSSVAAAIAASRAKAKAIAAAPPTLRHQATSPSVATPGRRPGSPAQKVSLARPSSPQRMTSASPPSTRSRILNNNGTVNRSVSASVILSHSRTLSGGRPITPPSPEQSSFSRRISSPLASPSRSQSRPVQKVALTPHTLPRANTQPPPRESAMFPETGGDEDSLLLAQAIPIPEVDSDSEHSDKVLDFSAAQQNARSNSQAHSFSPKSVDSRPMPLTHALSSDSITDLVQAPQPIVEDALRARAEQAESAAERLLELNEPEDGAHHIPPSLLVGSSGANGTTPVKAKAKPSPLPIGHSPHVGTVTPLNRPSAILRQAALFRDSPAPNGRVPSLLDVLQDKKHESAWWLKRKALISKRLSESEKSNPLQDLPDLIAKLSANTAAIDTLEQLIFLSRSNPAADAVSPLSPEFGLPSSPSPSPFMSSSSLSSKAPELWETNRNFDHLFNTLIQFLDPSKSGEELEYGLILLWELLENQGGYFEGHEADVFSLLLQIRYCNQVNVLEASNTIRDALTTRIEPVYGLTTMHASLRTFHSQEPPPTATAEAKSSTYAFGLIALSKFILRLPPEVAEEELPRMRGTLIAALNDKTSLVVRESAAAAIISAQLVLRDETQLFTLLDGLADEKKNLLTYLFDKHGARGQAVGVTGIDRLEKEMRRLDTRTSTPPRPPLAA